MCGRGRREKHTIGSQETLTGRQPPTETGVHPEASGRHDVDPPRWADAWEASCPAWTAFREQVGPRGAWRPAGCPRRTFPRPGQLRPAAVSQVPVSQVSPRGETGLVQVPRSPSLLVPVRCPPREAGRAWQRGGRNTRGVWSVWEGRGVPVPGANRTDSFRRGSGQTAKNWKTLTPPTPPHTPPGEQEGRDVNMF